MDDFSKTFATGNRWAGGSGGSDTAGLGGRGGPYRLWDGNPAARQTIDGCGVFFLIFSCKGHWCGNREFMDFMENDLR